MTTIRSLLAAGRQALAQAPFAPSPREAALLLGHALGRDEAQLLAHDEDEAGAGPEAAFRGLLARRLAGEPVAYLLGHREFFGRRFQVDRRVLVPRPETEHLVEAALALPLPPAARLLDLGTGSGCLAVTLALELPAARVVAVDLSPGALAVAAANALRLGARPRVAFVGCDLATALVVAPFDVVVSNPPYLEPSELPGLSPEVAGHEPHLALFAPAGFQSFLRRLLALATGLRPGAHLLFEIGYGQWPWIAEELAGRPFDCLEIRPDLAGIPRVVVLRRR